MSLRYKLILAFLVVGVVPLALVGFFAVYKAENVASDLVKKELTILEEAKRHEVQNYFTTIKSQMRTFSNNGMIRSAMKGFPVAVDVMKVKLASTTINTSKLQARYKYQKENTPGADQSDQRRWQDIDDLAKRMQHLYISDNSHPIGAKEKLDNAGDGSMYSRLHEKYHPVVRQYLQEFGYYDIFLVDPRDGRIVYSVFKEVDFGTSLTTGPYADTNFGRVTQAALQAKEQNATILADFEPYEPSYNGYASFIASPIYEEGDLLGVAVFQMPVDRLNAMVGETGDKESQTLQTYIVNDQGQMSTDSPLTEDNTLGKQLAGPLIDQVITARTEGHATLESYHGNTVVAHYAPMDIAGLNWFMVAEAEHAEIMAPVTSMRNIIIGVILLSILVVIGAALFIARQVMQPISVITQKVDSLIKRVSQLATNIRDAVDGVVAAAEETSQQSVVVKENSKKAAENTGSVAAAVEEMDASIAQINQSVEQTDQQIENSSQRAEAAAGVVSRLEESSQRIAEVITLISNIADQTNLLALNAAIEAARAGDAGRGFAVVADEVKKLADNTIKATNDIQEQVQGVQGISVETADALKSIQEAVAGVRENAAAVVTAVKEQSQATAEISDRLNTTVEEVNQVDTNMQGIEEATSDTNTSVNEVLTTVQDMEENLRTLQEDVTITLRRAGIDVKENS